MRKRIRRATFPATETRIAHAKQIIVAAFAQAAALNVIHEERINNECSKDPIMIYADERIYDVSLDLYEDQQQETVAMPEDVSLNSIRSFNIQQKDLFKSVSAVIEEGIKSDENTEEMLLFITGGADSSKSFILKLLVEHVKRCYNPRVDAIIKLSFSEVTSLIGVTASQIFAKTLYFSLLIERGTGTT